MKLAFKILVVISLFIQSSFASEASLPAASESKKSKKRKAARVVSPYYDSSDSESVRGKSFFTVCGLSKIAVHQNCYLSLCGQRCPECYDYWCGITTIGAIKAFKDGIDLKRDCSLCCEPLLEKRK